MAVVDIWLFRNDGWRDIDLVGFDVEAVDGSIGKVDESSYDVRGGRLVVDTGPWIFGHRVLLPAGTVERIDPEERTIHVACTRDQIKNAPRYDEENLDDEERYRKELSDYYGAPAPSGPARKPPTVL